MNNCLPQQTGKTTGYSRFSSAFYLPVKKAAA
jgi:hypothetical protein